MVRRALTRGFWQAYSLSLGACTSDFLWAFGVAIGAGAVADIPGVRSGLGFVSAAVLLVLAWIYLRGAFATYKANKSGQALAPQKELDSARRGFGLGFMLAMTSPWNIAFWLAVIGQGAAEHQGIAGSLAIAAAVVVGSAAWGLTLCAGVRLGARFTDRKGAWDIAARGLTGALMLAFAIRSLWRLAYGG